MNNFNLLLTFTIRPKLPLMKKLLLFIFLFAPFWVAAQVGVGQWRDHLPYGNCIDVCEGNGVIYAATPFSVFFFDLEDFSTNRISKVNGLAESEVSSIAFNSEQNALVVGYVNGNIDLIFNESQIVNLRDLKNSNIPGGCGAHVDNCRGQRRDP